MVLPCTYSVMINYTNMCFMVHCYNNMLIIALLCNQPRIKASGGPGSGGFRATRKHLWVLGFLVHARVRILNARKGEGGILNRRGEGGGGILNAIRDSKVPEGGWGDSIRARRGEGGF